VFTVVDDFTRKSLVLRERASSPSSCAADALRQAMQTHRANKPKALSVPTTGELGTKTRSEDDAVLVSAKTIPCPNKSGPFLAHDEQPWIPLRKFEAK